MLRHSITLLAMLTATTAAADVRVISPLDATREVRVISPTDDGLAAVRVVTPREAPARVYRLADLRAASGSDGGQTAFSVTPRRGSAAGRAAFGGSGGPTGPPFGGTRSGNIFGAGPRSGPLFSGRTR